MRTEWTWRHNRFIAVKDATTDRAEAERQTERCRAANPGDDIGVVMRQVSDWEPAELAEAEVRMSAILAAKDDGLSDIEAALAGARAVTVFRSAEVAAEVAEYGDLLAEVCTCPPPEAGGVAGVNRGHLLGCPELAGGQAVQDATSGEGDFRCCQ